MERGRLDLPSARTKFENQRAVVDGDAVELRPRGPRPGPRGVHLTSVGIPEGEGIQGFVKEWKSIQADSWVLYTGEWL